MKLDTVHDENMTLAYVKHTPLSFKQSTENFQFHRSPQNKASEIKKIRGISFYLLKAYFLSIKLSLVIFCGKKGIIGTLSAGNVAKMAYIPVFSFRSSTRTSAF